MRVHVPYAGLSIINYAMSKEEELELGSRPLCGAFDN